MSAAARVAHRQNVRAAETRLVVLNDGLRFLQACTVTRAAFKLNCHMFVPKSVMHIVLNLMEQRLTEPRLLRSPLRPDMNIKAVAVLIAIPSSETQMTVRAATSAGLLKRRRASHAMAPTETRRKIALNNAARMDVPRSP